MWAVVSVDVFPAGGLLECSTLATPLITLLWGGDDSSKGAFERGRSALCSFSL